MGDVVSGRRQATGPFRAIASPPESSGQRSCADQSPDRALVQIVPQSRCVGNHMRPWLLARSLSWTEDGTGLVILDHLGNARAD